MDEKLPTLEEMTDILDLQELSPPDIKAKIALVLFFIVFTLMLFYFIFRFFKNKKEKTQKRQLSPKEEAIIKFQQLNQKDFLTHQLFRQYFFELTEILKRFLSLKLLLPIEDYTTEEMEKLFKGANYFTEEKKILLLNLLKKMDQIKFAKQIPGMSDVEEMKQHFLMMIED